MCQSLDVPDFLNGIITPGAPAAYTETDRRELRDLAVHLLVDNQKLQRAGAATRMHHLLHVQPAIDHAIKVGWDRGDLHAAADREYGQWLIDNAGR
ncbi:hypothetical protein AB0K53_00975 [Streptomyces tuirus]|uniref:hypothetical protein n=1 Tax=Streptomyces tuirus TaxID=68278 RepID=UPI00343FE825